MKRREFLTALSAAALLPTPSFSSMLPVLTAAPVTRKLHDAAQEPANMWGYNGSTPGPVLRVKQNTQLKLHFDNQLNQGSAVHWHGVRLVNAVDGVPGMTQPLVAPNAQFDYAFTPPDAGTYWYHSHNRSWEQVARGLYGALIIEEETPPDVDHDIIALIDDWRLTEAGTLMESFGNMHDQAHQGRLGNFASAQLDPQPVLKKGDRIRLRLINAATARIFPLELQGIEGKVVALDGMPLENPAPMERLMIAPAQRIDVIADVTDARKVMIDFHTRQGLYLLGELAVEGENTQRQPAPVAALPPNKRPKPNLDEAITLELLMEGGAMSPRMRDLGGIWAFNGQSEISDKPFHSFARGQTAKIKIINETMFPHGIHLHGHHFYELEKDGSLGPLRDTTLLNRGETRTIACVFDNPGKWLLHCHMLDHQAAGMKTWVDVS